jgi:hypothetical protein
MVVAEEEEDGGAVAEEEDRGIRASISLEAEEEDRHMPHLLLQQQVQLLVAVRLLIQMEQ